MTDNLEIWEKVRRVPTEHLKAFTRGGGFSGTAIKPMWGIKTMTEQFGPCGQGWGINAPIFAVHPVGDEILVYCTVSVWHGKPENLVHGVGGDKMLAQFSKGLKSDDEAFKKAFTDAVGNALKFLGVAADIHMGLWDGNKYVDEDAPAKGKPSNITVMQKAEARPEYKKISDGVRQIKDTGNLEDLKAWYNSNLKTIETFDDGWVDAIIAEFDDAKAHLKAKAA